MFRNYVTSILRYVSKNKAFTLINVLGLAIGMMACMLITQFVLHEFSYDNFHVNRDRIFRLQLDRYSPHSKGGPYQSCDVVAVRINDE